jgi:hypothetical protein
VDKYEAEVERLLDENGAVLVRQNKHKVYKFPNGREVVMSSTPSDWRASRKKLAFLRRMLEGRFPKKLVAPVATTVKSVTAPTIIRRGQAPHPEWSNAPVVIPKLESGASFTVATPTMTKRSFRQCDPYYVANSSEEFWKLDPCGRIRAIGKVAQITGSTIEYIDLLYGAVPNQFIAASGGNVMSVPVFNRVAQHARFICHPAVIVGGDTLVEAQAFQL